MKPQPAAIASPTMITQSEGHEREQRAAYPHRDRADDQRAPSEARDRAAEPEHRDADPPDK